MYSTWSVVGLKSELRKRNASTAGKKASLIKRLEQYDRNHLFGVEEELEDEVPSLPALDNFRDVNASTTLPSLTKYHIQEFVDRFQVPLKGKLMYESRCLVSLRAAFEVNHVYFHAQCKAQMKKLLYIVWLKLNSNGTIEESHCECAAGSGLEAHCKHVLTVLHGLEDMVRTKTIIMHKSCTEEIMCFKKPRKQFFNSPMQSHKLPNKRQSSKAVIFCPVKDEDVMENYEDYVKNLAVSFASISGSKMPYLQVIKPANPYSLEHDHNYTDKSAKDMLLESLLLKNITVGQIEEIKTATTLQNASKEWHQARSVRITASNFHAVCHSRDCTRKVMAQNILHPKQFSSKATSHGKAQEPIALKKYESFLSVKVDQCGLCISFSHPFLAASPDGYLGDDTVIEVKCPYVSRHCAITPTTVPFLYYDYNGVLKLKEKHNYYTQIQGQLFCMNRKYANLVIYTFVDMKIVYVNRDEDFIVVMVHNLTSFYKDYLQPMIFDKYLYKYYDSVIVP